MSRINRALALLCLIFALAAPALGESEFLLSAGAASDSAVNYKTAVAERGAYIKTQTTSLAEYYPDTWQVKCEISGAKFVEFKVTRNQEVKKGDVIALFQVDIDEVRLASLKLSLTRSEAARDEGLEDRRRAIEDMYAGVSLGADSYEREITALKIERAELEMEKFAFERENAIRDLERQIAEIETRRASNALLAPRDGIITELTYKREGDSVWEGEALATMYDPSELLFALDNKSGYFRYGMEVTVEVGLAKKRIALTGKIVAADNAIPESRRTGYALVKLDPYDPEINLRAPSITAQTYMVGDAILLPRKAVTFDGGQYYVTKLVNGLPQKRYVNFGLSNNTQVWVLQGVAEGEEIIID